MAFRISMSPPPDGVFVSTPRIVGWTERTYRLYIRSDLPHRRLLDVEHNGDGIESLYLEITIGKNKTVISCIYKHPKMKLELFKNKICFIADKVFTTCIDTIFPWGYELLSVAQ